MSDVNTTECTWRIVRHFDNGKKKLIRTRLTRIEAIEYRLGSSKSVGIDYTDEMEKETVPFTKHYKI